MRHAVPLLPLVLVLAACTAPNPPAEPAAPAAPVAPATPDTPATPAAAVDAQALAASHWRLDSAVDAGGQSIGALFPEPGGPLQLGFADGQISVSGGCNRMSGGFTLADGTLSVGPLAQTKMFCGGGGLMAADEAIAARLSGGGTLAFDDDGRLVLATADGDRLAFRAEATAETRFGGEGERVFLEVAPQRVPCPHAMIPDFQCLHVREISFDENGVKTGTGEWQFFYQDIEGYTHEPGVRNVLRLKRFNVQDPPADGFSVAYVLDMVVETEQVAP